MHQHITWMPIILFSAAIFGFAVYEHMRTLPRKRARRSDFRRMRSPAERARRRATPPAQTQDEFRTARPVARRRFAR